LSTDFPKNCKFCQCLFLCVYKKTYSFHQSLFPFFGHNSPLISSAQKDLLFCEKAEVFPDFSTTFSNSWFLEKYFDSVVFYKKTTFAV